MTFEQFKATRRFSWDIERELKADLGADGKMIGFMYADQLYIEWDKDLEIWCLTLYSQGFTEKIAIERLERRLYDFAKSEGFLA